MSYHNAVLQRSILHVIQSYHKIDFNTLDEEVKEQGKKHGRIFTTDEILEILEYLKDVRAITVREGEYYANQ